MLHKRRGRFCWWCRRPACARPMTKIVREKAGGRRRKKLRSLSVALVINVVYIYNACATSRSSRAIHRHGATVGERRGQRMMPLWVRGRVWAAMCYDVQVWAMVKTHMLVPSVGQTNINRHHRCYSGLEELVCGHHRWYWFCRPMLTPAPLLVAWKLTS